MTYTAKMAAKPPALGRPLHYADLLCESIADNPAAGTPSYHHWEFDHGPLQRFYVGGLRWFMQCTGVSDNAKLAAFGTAAAEVCASETTWATMPESNGAWESCSLNQFRYAKNRKAMHFPKAALVILSCELLLADLVKRGQKMHTSITIADLYSNMAIIPACWNINDFDMNFVSEIEKQAPAALSNIRDAANQSAKTFIDHLATGHTVTSDTAIAVKNYIDANFPSLSCGAVRARPGTHLGKLNATEFEVVEAG